MATCQDRPQKPARYALRALRVAATEVSDGQAVACRTACKHVPRAVHEVCGEGSGEGGAGEGLAHDRADGGERAGLRVRCAGIERVVLGAHEFARDGRSVATFASGVAGESAAFGAAYFDGVEGDRAAADGGGSAWKEA